MGRANRVMTLMGNEVSVTDDERADGSKAQNAADNSVALGVD